MATRAHKITQEFIANRDKFQHSFAAAHAFLLRLEQEGPARGLWLSTSVNAHLYKHGGFLAYLRLENPELQPPALLLSPGYHQQIVEQTTDRSTALFPALVQDLVQLESRLEQGWAIRRSNGATELTSKTPASFFARLFEALVILDVVANK